jgi:hypothetical protein
MTRLSHSALLSEVGGSSQQWFVGKMKPFSVVFYIEGPAMTESACFWSVSGVFTDCNLVMGNFIHHDKACIFRSCAILDVVACHQH